jgi:dTMP kinase
VSRGFFVSVEGIDRCGKTTQAERLCLALAADGHAVGPAETPGRLLREPGDTPAGEAIRDLLLHRSEEIAPWSEAFLYAAARAQLVAGVVAPTLAAGRVVVLDRYIDSSLAYQGHARGLGVDRVLALNEWGTGGLLPDLTLLFDIDPGLAAGRSGDADRIEAEGVAFQALVAEGYRGIAQRFASRIVVFDGSRPVDDLAADVAALVAGRLEARDVR